MRSKLILTLLVVAVVVGLTSYWASRQSSKTPGSQVLIGNVPDRYCPQTAQVIVTPVTVGTIEFDRSVTVANCRTIDLAAILTDSKTAKNLYVKLPEALASKIQVDLPTGSYSFTPILGDVNGDNIIDGVDQGLVEKALLTDQSVATESVDIDQDKAVTVLDLGFTKINAQVGVKRPDKKSWELPL